MTENTMSAALAERLRNAESTDEVVQACAEAGIPITKEQLEGPVSVSPDGELSEDALLQVSGGVTIDWIRIIWQHFRNFRHRSSIGGGNGAFGGGNGGIHGGGGRRF